jgi:murein DD-endopeptidase MepM/ murein hydrolase activator NlpD
MTGAVVNDASFCRIHSVMRSMTYKLIATHIDLIKSCYSFCFLCALVLFAETHAQDRKADEPQAADELVLPDKYILNYPAMDGCCPPIRSAFHDATSNFTIVRNRRVRFQPNGGYGLPIVDKVDGKNLIHVGADLGWFQIGEPVFAMGAGVVRVSQGPLPTEQKKSEKNAPAKESLPAPMPWGNVVMIEHRLPSGEFFMSIYGHLDTNRRVDMGDVVKAGQHLGNIGRRNPRINGGYDPHLHFGVREGRMIREGIVLFRTSYLGQTYDVKIASFDEDRVQLALPTDRPKHLTFRLGDEKLTVEEHDGKPCLPAKILWRTRDSELSLAGYALSTKGWRDPIAFLRERHADTQPAPFTP